MGGLVFRTFGPGLLENRRKSSVHRMLDGTATPTKGLFGSLCLEVWHAKGKDANAATTTQSNHSKPETSKPQSRRSLNLTNHPKTRKTLNPKLPKP